MLLIILVLCTAYLPSYGFQSYIKLKLPQNIVGRYQVITQAGPDDSVFGSEFVSNKNKKKSFPKPGSQGKNNAALTDEEWAQLQQIKKQSKQCKKKMMIY